MLNHFVFRHNQPPTVLTNSKQMTLVKTVTVCLRLPTQFQVSEQQIRFKNRIAFINVTIFFLDFPTKDVRIFYLSYTQLT